MKRFTATVLSSALVLGATSAQAALPDEATLYKNPQCGCCDAYARHLEELGANMVCLDFIAQGMYQEAADVVASRSGELITGITSGDWALARQLRTYRLGDPPLVPLGMLEVAARLQRRDERRARNISRGGKAGRSPAR